MIHSLTVLLIGFSVVGLAILLTAHIFFLGTQKSVLGTTACVVLSATLAGLQLEHLRHLSTDAELLLSTQYVAMLFTAPPAFYFFSRDILLPEARVSALHMLHALPPFVGVLLPSELVAATAFTIGAGYSIWLARVVYGMRQHVSRFRFEMFFFGLFASIASGVLVLVLSIPWIGSSAFYLVYANAIGSTLVLVTAALLIFPEILSDISDAAKLSYANSTLKGVNVAEKLEMLNKLMAADKLYQNENLSLAMLAEAISLSAHQLSELINSNFSVGFSRYIRERRVEEAKRILTEDQRSSVLSVGMMCGFGSQSNFYAAFREVAGESPAAFRKKAVKVGSESEMTRLEPRK